MANLTLTIFGGTGGTGSNLLACALARGYRVTVLVSDRSKLGSLGVGQTVVEGDAMGRAAVGNDIPSGTDAVLSALGHTAGSPGASRLTLSAR